MTTESRISDRHGAEESRQELSRRLDSIGWALFLIWVGVAFIADLGWGWGMVGMAIIVLGESAFRWSRDLTVSGLWVAIGSVFLAAGLWHLFEVPWPLAPLILIGCGLVVLWGAFKGRHLNEK